uniref:Glycosyltransferase n=1 Tax=viral metagenome TaxID=1070528 RepID=A0A6C0AZ36_9ZZZZ
MTTIVTAFLFTNNQNKGLHRNIDSYMEHGKKLLLSDKNMVIFMEEDIYNQYYKDIQFDENKRFYFIKRENLYLYDYYEQLENFNIITDNPGKDTIDFIFVQCHKTEWVKEAIEKNPFNSEQFVWVDFCIYHVIRNDEIFYSCINEITEKKHENCIRIATGIANAGIDIYRQIKWSFLGGIFGGDKDTLLFFAEKMKEKCISIITTHKTIMWEINIWYLLHEDNPTLFSGYIAGHNASMMQLY